jgi:hypothetical protein
VIWRRLALPRLMCRLGGKKGVNRRASPYRLKNYGHDRCNLSALKEEVGSWDRSSHAGGHARS